jgi:[ribosomal protein S5]-alanine N-acetyltransferase
MQPTELRTNRLLLRPFRLEDAENVFAYLNDEEVVYFLTRHPPPNHVREVEKMLTRILQTPWQDFPHFAVVLDAQVVGEVSLGVEHADRIANLGYGIARQHWGKGLATEAARVVLNYGFHSVDLAKIYARADPRNVGSVRVLEKLGMQREGLLRSHHIRRGERVDRVMYGLLRPEWEAIGPLAPVASETKHSL